MNIGIGIAKQGVEIVLFKDLEYKLKLNKRVRFDTGRLRDEVRRTKSLMGAHPH